MVHDDGGVGREAEPVEASWTASGGRGEKTGSGASGTTASRSKGTADSRASSSRAAWETVNSRVALRMATASFARQAARATRDGSRAAPNRATCASCRPTTAGGPGTGTYVTSDGNRNAS